MSDAPEPSHEPSVVRPTPDLGVVERVRAWVTWFGVARLAVTAASVALVAVAGFWLVRAPAPPAEATLPTATEPTTPSTVPATETDPGPATGDDRTGAVAEPSNGEPTEIVVHVAGEVEAPGVYVLALDRRVHDAIDAAGGPTAGADTDRLNLAQVLHDGQRVFVPDADDDAGPIPLVAPEVASADTSDDEPPGPVDVNRADSESLDRLPGVGPSTAKAIIDERERNGPFVSIDDLERVPGIGPAKLDALRDLVVV